MASRPADANRALFTAARAPYRSAMFGPFYLIVAGLWVVWFVTWHIAALWCDKPTARAPRRSYRLHVVIVALGVALTFGVFPRFEQPLWQVAPGLGWAMVALALAGIAFAWWARAHLGRLWSGGIERMERHRVVDSGPYALVRHPIYTGLIAALVAAAVVHATPLALAGPVLFALGFGLKAKVEERFLDAEIGGYGEYRRRVPMLVPFSPR
ncbi:MAG TPA: isoprenylcysteine carboxylmethyltransferase family protein [Croceibacterium sp.]|nr:isoprenylcysteine carboxylmethyltransferase family protein [Croceibacterium sp.]